MGDLNLANAANVHVVKENEEDKPPTVPAKPLRYPCRFCGRKHDGKRQACPAWGKKCNKCEKDNHFAKKCSLNSNSKQQKQVSMVEEEDDYPVFQVFKVLASHSSYSNLVTLKIASGTSYALTSTLGPVTMFYRFISTRR